MRLALACSSVEFMNFGRSRSLVAPRIPPYPIHLLSCFFAKIFPWKSDQGISAFDLRPPVPWPQRKLFEIRSRKFEAPGDQASKVCSQKLSRPGTAAQIGMIRSKFSASISMIFCFSRQCASGSVCVAIETSLNFHCWIPNISKKMKHKIYVGGGVIETWHSYPGFHNPVLHVHFQRSDSARRSTFGCCEGREMSADF